MTPKPPGQLDQITIHGFKSIERLDRFDLGALNVLIGANGAGKSNFVEFFRLLRAIVEERLQAYVTKNSPADGYFFNGIKQTKKIEADLVFGANRYAFSLEPGSEGQIVIAQESTQYIPKGNLREISSGRLESVLRKRKNDSGVMTERGQNYYVHRSLSGWQVYHFHDTSMLAGMRRPIGVEQTGQLWPDAGNLAAFLLHLRECDRPRYDFLVKTIRRIAPYFEDFELRVTKADPEDQVRLTWKRKGTAYTFSPGHFSDGTIRFICLAAALLQPDPPTTIVLDEPELGLHPEAIGLLGGLLRSAASRMQIIVATQSPLLLDEFEPDQVITVDQAEGASRFRRLDPSQYAAWLDEFTIADLWRKGNIDGGVNNA